MGCSLGIGLLLMCLALAQVAMTQDTRKKTVTTILIEPFLMKTENGYTGYIVDLLEKVSHLMKFEYELREVVDGKYGARENETWDGMIGELVREEADIAAAPLTITSMRERVVDFTSPYLITGISAVAAPVGFETSSLFLVLQVFNYKVWILLAIAFVAVSLCLWVVNRVNPYELGKLSSSVKADTNEKSMFSCRGSFWFGISTLSWQGYDRTPRSLAGRVLVSFWFLFVVLILALFTAGLMHNLFYLHVTGFRPPFHGISDLADEPGDYQYGTISGGSTADFFRTSSVMTYEKIYVVMKTASPSAFVKSLQEGLERARSQTYVFISEEVLLSYHTRKKPCNSLVRFGPLLNQVGFGLATPRDSELHKPLSLAILQLKENGDLGKLQQKWLVDYGNCPTEPVVSRRRQPPVTSDNAREGVRVDERVVAGPLLILLLGVFLSAIVTGAEFVHFTLTKKETEPTEMM